MLLYNLLVVQVCVHQDAEKAGLVQDRGPHHGRPEVQRPHLTDAGTARVLGPVQF